MIIRLLLICIELDETNFATALILRRQTHKPANQPSPANIIGENQLCKFKKLGERFLRKKTLELRLPRVANTAKRDNLRRSFCEVSPVKLRLHRVADADKRDKNCEINCEKVKE